MPEPNPKTIAGGRIHLTYADYLELPDDGKRYEILDGELAVTPAPVLQHQRVSRRIQRLLEDHLTVAGGEVFDAPVDVILDDHTIVQPDLIFVSSERASVLRDKNVQGPPDLIVEIASPSTYRRDRSRKAALYARFGVQHYWIADPGTRRLEMFRLQESRYQLAASGESPQHLEAPDFPGLKFDLERLFR